MMNLYQLELHKHYKYHFIKLLFHNYLLLNLLYYNIFIN